MRWWVIREGHVVGWVIAADETEAARQADVKYPPSWEAANAVEITRRKRRKP